MLRVLFMTVYATRVTQMTGGFRWYLEISKRFAKEKVDVYSLVNSRAPTGSGKQLHFSYPPTFEPQHLWLCLAILKTIINTYVAISRIKPHIIITQGPDRLNNIVTLVVRLTTKTPIAFMFYHWNFGYGISDICKQLKKTDRSWFLTSWEWWFTILALRVSTFVIALSSFSAEQLRKLGVSKEKIVVTGAGINCEEVAKALPSMEHFDGVFVGVMKVEKGVFDLIRIWKGVVRKKPNAKLVVIGAESPLKETWLNDVKTNNLVGNIIYLGAIKDDDIVYGIFKSAKVFVFPSHIEGFCLVVGEAMVGGLPVVCWDIPVLREVYGESSAVKLVPKGGYEEFSNEVCNLLEDEAYRLALSEAGRKYPLKFSWDNVVYRLLKILRSIAA